MFKKYLMTVSILVLFVSAGFAQDVGKVDAETKDKINAALNGYYALKDALVASDLELANTKAAELLPLFSSISTAKMSVVQKNLWEKLETPIKNDVEHIKETKDLAHQRDHFVKLSNNFYSLVNAFKANKAEAYLHYCPMKKATWLSASKEVRNPYYGSKMLDCGSVRTTLKKN